MWDEERIIVPVSLRFCKKARRSWSRIAGGVDLRTHAVAYTASAATRLHAQANGWELPPAQAAGLITLTRTRQVRGAVEHTVADAVLERPILTGRCALRAPRCGFAMSVAML